MRVAGPLPVGALLHAELPAGVWLLSVLPSPPCIRKALEGRAPK